MALRRGVFVAGLFLLVLLGTLPVSGRASVPLSTPTVVAGGGGGLTIPCCTAPFPAPTDVKLQLPQFIAAGGAQLYLPVPATNQVYAANFNNPATIKTVAGDGTQGSGGDGSAATGAELDGPSAVAIGGPGYYVADTNNNRVRAVDTGDGKINTVAGGAVFNGPRDISVSAGGGYYVLDTSGVRRVDAGAITATWNRYDPIYAVDAIDDTHFWIATLNGIVEGLIDTTDAVHGGTAIGGFAASSRTFRDVIGLADGGVLAWDDGNDAWGGIVRFAPGGEESVVLGGLTPSPYTLTAHMALTGNGLYFTRYSDPTAGSPYYGYVEELPAAEVKSGPPPVTGSADATWTFASWDANATFDCRLTFTGPGGHMGPFAPCTDGVTYGDPTPLADGLHTIEYVAHTNAGALASSTERTWVSDTTAPDVPALEQPGAGRAVNSGQPDFTWDATTDPFATDNTHAGLDHYELWIDGSKSGPSIVASCSTTCTAKSASALTDGTHTWQVKAVDGVGNTSASSVRNVVVDTAPPGAAGLVDPAGGASFSSGQPQLSWNAASDVGTGIASYDVELDGTALGLDLGPTTLTFTPPSALAEGTHSWRVIAKDAAGNAGTSTTRSFRVDTTAPTAALTVAPNPVLAGQSATLDASASSDANGGSIARYEFDFDGDGSYEQDGGTNAKAAHIFNTGGTFTVGVRVTDAVGLTATTTAPLRVTSRSGTTGPTGITINNGAQYTRTPKVTLFINPPVGTTSLLIANDGGFLTAETFATLDQIPWTLDSSGPERLPKTVYVRFLNGPISSPNFTDDIILDETPPKVDQASVAPAAGAASARAARLLAWKVKLKATDSNSGVGAVQITANKRKPGALIPYKRKLTVRSAKRPSFIRARDRAGNFSHWRKATKR